jgi:hypothetical protein
MRYCLVIAILFLSSCSVEYHISQMKWHRDKAVSMGYNPQLDTIRRINTTGQIQIDYKPNIKLYFNNVADTILERYCDDLKSGDVARVKKTKQALKDVLLDSYKYIEIDTLVRFPDGASVHIKVGQGQLTVEQETVYTEETIIIESKYWQHKEFWISIVIFVLFAALVYLSRK